MRDFLGVNTLGLLIHFPHLSGSPLLGGELANDLPLLLELECEAVEVGHLLEA